MGIFDLLNGPDINDGLKDYQAEEKAILLDAREADEYAEGHIGGSINLPLSRFMEQTPSLRIRACLSMYTATAAQEASVWQQGLLNLDLKRW